jgi:predicted phage terminase large subunit-like protein
VPIVGPEDPGAAGKDAALDFTRLLAGFRVKTKRQTGSKVLRADGLSAQVNQGNVWLSRAEWNSAFVEELRTFPMSKHDDQVDACAEAFNELVGVSDPWNW